jgi:hypothetical protein
LSRFQRQAAFILDQILDLLQTVARLGLCSRV